MKNLSSSKEPIQCCWYRLIGSTHANKFFFSQQNEQEAEIARENGAAVVGGVELIKWVFIYFLRII